MFTNFHQHYLKDNTADPDISAAKIVYGLSCKIIFAKKMFAILICY